MYLQTNTTVIKNKVGLLNLAQELGNISKACKIMGFSRDTFYRYQEAVETGGVDLLVNRSKRGPNTKNSKSSTCPTYLGRIFPLCRGKCSFPLMQTFDKGFKIFSRIEFIQFA